jgi:hypothetical protein
MCLTYVRIRIGKPVIGQRVALIVPHLCRYQPPRSPPVKITAAIAADFPPAAAALSTPLLPFAVIKAIALILPDVLALASLEVRALVLVLRAALLLGLADLGAVVLAEAAEAVGLG